MHLQDEQLAASSNGNSNRATEVIVTEGIITGSPDSSRGNMKPPTAEVRGRSTSKVTRGTQTDPEPVDAGNLRSGTVADEYGAACDGGLYRPAQPNIVTLKSADTQTETVGGEHDGDSDQFNSLTGNEGEGEGLEVAEVECDSRGKSSVSGTSVGVGQSHPGLGVAGDEAVGGVSPTVLDVLDGLDADIDGGYEVVVDIDGPSGNMLVEGGTTRKMSSKAQMSGALMAQNGKRKAKEALAELEDDVAGQQPAMKKISY